MERIKDVIYNPYLSDLIRSVESPFKAEIILHMDIIHKTPIWFKPNLRIDFKKSWFDKGIRTLNDIVDSFGRPM